MTWEELKEKAKEIGYVKWTMYGDYGEPIDAMTKIDNIGTKITIDENCHMYIHRLKPEQMLMIMRGLE